jgi:hypothetical protein
LAVVPLETVGFLRRRFPEGKVRKTVGFLRRRFSDLEQTGAVHATGNTTATSGVHGHQVLGLQVSQTGDATEIGFNTAIRRAAGDGVVQIGVASLHGDEAALLGATQVADVVGDGWSSFGTLGARHVTDHFI